MGQRLRWTHALADGRGVTVSRVAGVHETGDDRGESPNERAGREATREQGDDRGESPNERAGREATREQGDDRGESPNERAGREAVERVAEDAGRPRRRYDCRLPDGTTVDALSRDARLARDGDRLTVVVPDGVGTARVRFETAEGRTTLRLFDPTLGGHLTAALRGDGEAARSLVDAFGSAVAAVHACASILDVAGVVELVDALASASGAAADDLHARRYALCRAAGRGANGLSVASPSEFEALADGLDGVEAIGDVTALDALGDLAAVGGLDAIGEMGYDLARLDGRDDGRFRAYRLAAVAQDRGVDAARDAAGPPRGNYERLKARASDADYWKRGRAWRALLGPASRRSRAEFAYALANACYWTGEVSRTDARADELCYDGALAAAAAAGVEWVAERARYERARAVGHRHRSARNHAFAVAAFERAERVGAASDARDLSPWDPRYSRAVVASNARSAVGDHDGAVATLEAALDDLDDYDVPAVRAAEVRHHLEGQRHERLALIARGEPNGAVETHLDAAREHYDAVGFDRSVDRVAGKLDDARREAASGDRGEDVVEGDSGERRTPGPSPRPPSDGRGPTLADIPDLHDALTDADPNAVGSVDPGAVDPAVDGDLPAVDDPFVSNSLDPRDDR